MNEKKNENSSLPLLKNDEKDSKWYKNGLKFSCTQCGKCCTGMPGAAWMTLDEIEALAQFLNISLNEVVQKYLRKIDGRWALKEKGDNYDCIFLQDKKCTVYPVRPKQCRTFPWWPQNLESEKSWSETARYCEGIRDDADIVPYEEIYNSLKAEH